MAAWIWFTIAGIINEAAAVCLIIAGIALPENCYWETFYHCESGTNTALITCGIVILVVGVIFLIAARKFRVQFFNQTPRVRRQTVQYLTPEQTMVLQQQERLRQLQMNSANRLPTRQTMYPNPVPNSNSNPPPYNNTLETYSYSIYDEPPPAYVVD